MHKARDGLLRVTGRRSGAACVFDGASSRRLAVTSFADIRRSLCHRAAFNCHRRRCLALAPDAASAALALPPPRKVARTRSARLLGLRLHSLPVAVCWPPLGRPLGFPKKLPPSFFHHKWRFRPTEPF